MENLHDECEELKQREKSLMVDMKKRGDAARQLVMSKDEEIHKLRLKLSGSAAEPASDIKQLPPVSPSRDESSKAAGSMSEEKSAGPARIASAPVSMILFYWIFEVRHVTPPPALFKFQMRSGPDTPTKSRMMEGSADPEQQLHYLKQAFAGFINARQSAEMQQLGRVICVILAFSPDEQTKLNENISKLTPVNTPLDNISAGIASFFW